MNVILPRKPARSRRHGVAFALSFALAALVAGEGCSALDGLSGGTDEAVPLPPDATPACTLPTAPACGAHGRCVEANGAATCSCDSGFTGATCTDCAIGAPCAAKTCADTKCAAHSTCDDSAGSPSCKCVVGYSQKDKDCVWSGVIKDPSFQNQPLGAWSLAGGVKINDMLTGNKDPGVAELQTATCASASVAQSFVMPSYETAEPLALTLYAKAQCTISIFTQINIPCTRPISLALSGRGIEPFGLIFGETPPPARVCLGDGAYGGTIALSMFPTVCTTTAKSTTLDFIDIAPASDCPAPGQVLNSDFEANGGWTASGTGAEVAAGVGDKSSRGGRLHNVKRCDAARLTGGFSVRAKDQKPALTFTVKGTLNRRMRVFAGLYQIGTIQGSAVYDKVSLCLPDWLKGTAPSLAFALEDDLPADGACGDPDDYEFVLDDVKVETDATCDDPAPVVDGGFERADALRYYIRNENGGAVGVSKSATNAHTGAGYANVIQLACSKSTSMRTYVTVPAPAPGSGGPAVEAFYKASTATAMTYTGPGGALTPTTTWTRTMKCLEPRRAGFTSIVDFTVSAGSNCGLGTLSVDDIRVTHDPACPE